MKVLARKAAGKYHICRGRGWRSATLCGREYYYVAPPEKVSTENKEFCKRCRYEFFRSLKRVEYAGVRVEEPE